MYPRAVEGWLRGMDDLAPFFEPSSALVVIDLQKGIVARDAQPHGTARVLQNAQSLVETFRRKGRLVVFVHVAFSGDWADALQLPADAPMAFAKPAQDWSDIAPQLGPKPDDVIVTKRQWGAFYGTDLDLQLRRRSITHLVLCGISTELGVESTARDAAERNYRLLFVEDAMSAMRSADDHHHACTRIFPLIGFVRTTA